MKERIEARMVVPAGTTLQATNLTGGPTTVTIPAGGYYPTTLVAALATQLNASRPFDYPATAAEMAAAVGGGTWNAGWLCNESSGNLAAAFGGVNLTAANTPIYGITGPRGGTDKAIGLDSLNDGFVAASPASFDAAGGDDLVLAAVVRYPATPTTSTLALLSKNSFGGTEGFYTLAVNVNGGMRMDIRDVLADGNTRVTIDTSGNMATNEWHVVMAVLERATNRLRVGFQSLTTGVQSMTPETDVSTVGSLANATASLRLGVSLYPVELDVAAAYIGVGVGAATGMSATLGTALSNFAAAINATWSATLSDTDGRVTIAGARNISITWNPTLTTLRDALGFTTDITNATTAQTGINQAKFCWFPQRAIDADSDVKQAPRRDDGRASIGPTGAMYGIVSSARPYKHRKVRFPMIDRSRVWAAEATLANASWETFYLEAQRGGHSWGVPFAPIKVYFDDGGTATPLGNGTVSSWNMPRPVTLDELQLSEAHYVGLVDIVLGDLYSSG